MTQVEYKADKVQAAFANGNYEFVLNEALPYAISGDAAAQCMVSLLYQCGLGVPQDFAKAEEWLLKATAQDDALAWNNLGTLYIVAGARFPRAAEKVQECWRRAKELGFDCAAPYPPSTGQD